MEEGNYSNLIADSLKLHVGRNENLDKMRSKLHVKAMKLMQELMLLEKEEPKSGSTGLEQRGMLQLLNYLIVDYFNWHGFRNTMKTFEMETGEKSRPKPREKLQQELNGKFSHNHLPILLQMLLKETKENDEMLLDKASWENIRLKATTPQKKVKKVPVKKVIKDDLIENEKAPVTQLMNIKKPKTKKGHTIGRMPKTSADSFDDSQDKSYDSKAKSLEIFNQVLKSFPGLKKEIRMKTINKESTQTKTEATAKAILAIVETLQGSKNKKIEETMPKANVPLVQPSRGQNPYLGPREYIVKQIPKDEPKPPQSKVNVRHRMAETYAERTRAR